MSRFTLFSPLVCAGILSAASHEPTLAHLPLRFEENHGQVSSSARYVARTTNFDVEFRANGPAMAVGTRRIDLNLLGSNPTPAIAGEERMAASTNYLVG